MKQLEIKAGLQVLKPVSEVFEAIVDPEKMKNYFISKSSGYMKEGESLTWKFPEMDIEFTVKIGKIEKDKYISYYWDGAFDGEQTFVEINLLPVENEITFIRDKIADWEIFTIIDLDSNCVALKAINGKYISADEKSLQLFARSDSIGKMEKFKMILIERK